MKFDVRAGDSVTDEDGRVWIWDGIHDIIGYFECGGYDFHITGQFKDEQFGGFDMYLDGGVVYITSQNKMEVMAYDMEKCSFRLFKSGLRQEASQYYSARLNDDEIILFSYELQYGAVLFDMRTGRFEKVTLWNTGRCNNRIAVRLVETEQEIMIAISDSNEILRFRKENLSYSSMSVPFVEEIGGVCAEDGDDMWVISKKGDCLVRVSGGECVKIEIGEKKDKDLFSRLVKCGDKIIALPRYAAELYVYDISKKRVEIIGIPMKSEELKEISSLFWNCFRRQNKIVLLPWRCPGILLELDLNTLQITMNTVNVNTDECWEYGKPEVALENEEMDLKFLLGVAGEEKIKNNLHGCIGQKIWRGLCCES